MRPAHEIPTPVRHGDRDSTVAGDASIVRCDMAWTTVGGRLHGPVAGGCCGDESMSLRRGVTGIVLALSGITMIPQDAAAQQTVKCESPEYRHRECSVPWGRSELDSRISQTPCVEGQNWGQGNGSVWVDRGCAANFRPARSGGGWGGGQREITCNSERNGYKECRTDWRNARVVRRTSNAACIEGQSWGVRRGVLWVDRGCAAVFAEGSGGPGGPGGPGWGGGGSGPQQIQCNSEKNGYKSCRTGDWRSARLVQRTSQAQCVEGRSWGYERGTLWVDNGCAGTFASAQGGGWGGGGGNAGRRLTCESQKNSYRECQAAGWRGADVLNKTSRAACVEGQSWGLRRGVLWVDRGCAAEFVETRR